MKNFFDLESDSYINDFRKTCLVNGFQPQKYFKSNKSLFNGNWSLQKSNQQVNRKILSKKIKLRVNQSSFCTFDLLHTIRFENIFNYLKHTGFMYLLSSFCLFFK